MPHKKYQQAKREKQKKGLRAAKPDAGKFSVHTRFQHYLETGEEEG